MRFIVYLAVIIILEIHTLIASGEVGSGVKHFKVSFENQTFV
jgi:hypothetical protein